MKLVALQLGKQNAILLSEIWYTVAVTRLLFVKTHHVICTDERPGHCWLRGHHKSTQTVHTLMHCFLWRFVRVCMQPHNGQGKAGRLQSSPHLELQHMWPLSMLITSAYWLAQRFAYVRAETSFLTTLM